MMKEIKNLMIFVLILTLCICLCSCVKSAGREETTPEQTEKGSVISTTEQEADPEETTALSSEVTTVTMGPSDIGTWRPTREYSVENGRNGERRFIKDYRYQYDEDGRLFRLLQFSENDTCNQYFEYSYDDQGYVIRRDVYEQPTSKQVSANATLKRSYFYQYDEDGWLTVLNDSGDKVMDGEKYTPKEQQLRLTNTSLLDAAEDGKTCIRDDNGNVVIVEDYYEDGSVHYVTEYEYTLIEME